MCEWIFDIAEKMASEGTELRHWPSLNTKSISGSICTKHLHDVVLLFCNKCQTPICMTCLDESHSDHQTVSMKKVADQNLRMLESEYESRTKGFIAPRNIDNEITGTKKNLDTVKANNIKIIGVISSETDQTTKMLDGILEDQEKIKTEVEFLNHVKNSIDELKINQDYSENYKDITKLRQELLAKPIFQNKKGIPHYDVAVPDLDHVDIANFRKTVKRFITGQSCIRMCDSCNLDVSSQHTVKLSCETHEMCMRCAKYEGVGKPSSNCPLCPISPLPTIITRKIFGHNATTAKEKCQICLKDLDFFSSDTTVLDKCKDTFCKNCIEKVCENQAVCPTCGEVYRRLKGTQPVDGNMTTIQSSRILPGYEGCGTITINYTFPDGLQGREHPYPGKPYKGLRRTAYLPNNYEGRKVKRLLSEAFESRIVFTIGRSTTNRKEGKITWNGIQHKTNVNGGPQEFGYPDPDYLTRVQEELAAKGYK